MARLLSHAGQSRTTTQVYSAVATAQLQALTLLASRLPRCISSRAVAGPAVERVLLGIVGITPLGLFGSKALEMAKMVTSIN
jgi:hypothetical protein